MPGHKTIAAYLETVGQQIRWRRARPVLLAELRQHLEDQRDAFAAEGREDAEHLAVEEMGDPVAVGAELDRLHRPRAQRGLLALTMAFALAGAVLRVWLTAGWADAGLDIDPGRTALALGLGCGALLGGYFLDLSFLGRHARALYVGALAAVFATWQLSPHTGVPVETYYVILCFPVVYACWLYACRGRGWRGLLLAAAGGIPLAAACFKTPWALGLLVLLVSGFVLLLTACWKDWFGVGRWGPILFSCGCAAAIAGGGVFLATRSQSIWRRLTAAFHPETDPLGAGWNALHIRQSLKVSQWWGQGRWEYTYPYETTIPHCDSDNLLTALIYRLGWLPFLLIVLVFALLVAWLLVRCLRQRGQLGRLVVTAVALNLALHGAFSVAWNLGFTLAGSAFPLLVGNTDTVVNMGLIGLALSAFRGDGISREPDAVPLRLPRWRVRVRIERL